MGRIDDQKHGKPAREPIVGPDSVPVVVQLHGPSGVKLDGSAAVLPDGILLGLILVMVVGLARLVSAMVRWVRRKPRYRLSIEVGGPEPRSLTLGFDSQARVEKYTQDLIAAIRKRGAAAVPRTAERQ